MLKQIVGQPPNAGASEPRSDSGISPSRSGTAETIPSGNSSAARPQRPSPPSGTKNILSSDVEIKGSIHFTQDMILDGKVEGEVLSEGQFTVGEHAVIKGEIVTRSVVVFGQVDGNITASESCELKNGAQLTGDMSTSVAVVEEGAIFNGQAKIGKPPGPKAGGGPGGKP
jgi:cytoskeletal protein CcmA (bactofilin family)